MDDPAPILLVVGWFAVLIWLGFNFGRWQVAKYLAGTALFIGFILGVIRCGVEGREGEWLLGWAVCGVSIWLLFKIDRWEKGNKKTG